NWTLTDKLNRIVINVGIAYEADVERALALLAEAANENENILGDPEPVVTFESFGDNVLHLVLRCYLGSLEFRLATISALHEAINRKFRDAGITIAFPQRDVHLDIREPIDVRLKPA
ncbi:MAG: mechanosensitive ion channel, partial [Gammaproteobacteria bacterium]|nr:mechanosensitive ion channel [Gammaproteobacteria bacterium]